MKSLSHLAIAAAGVLTLGGLVGGGIVFAADSGGPSPASTSVSYADQGTPGDDFLNALATKLGIDPQKLKDAIKQTSLDQLDKAVADGKISKDMADKIRKAIQDGTSMFGLGPFQKPQGGGGPGQPSGGQGRGFGFKALGDELDALAKFLGGGVTVDQLKTELQGKSLADVAQAHGKSRDELKKFLLAEAGARIDKAVADGKLPKDVAEKIKAGLSAEIDHLIDAKAPNGTSHTGGPGPRKPSNNGQPSGRPNRSSSGLN